MAETGHIEIKTVTVRLPWRMRLLMRWLSVRVRVERRWSTKSANLRRWNRRVRLHKDMEAQLQREMEKEIFGV